MKTRLFRLTKKAKRLRGLFVLAIAASASLAMINTAGAFGPDREIREYYQGAPGFESPVFNSFTNVPHIGDERDFLGAKVNDEGSFYTEMTETRRNDEILMRVYIHNNADSSLNYDGSGVARDTSVKVQLPTGFSTDESDAIATINASNADAVYDEMPLGLANDGYFALEYIAGSTQVSDKDSTRQLPDGIIENGVSLGDQNGCFESVRLVTFKVKVLSPAYSLQKLARIKGETAQDWRENVAASPGDEIEWSINFQNQGNTATENVMIVDNLPSGIDVDAGSVELVNALAPNGVKYDPSAVQDNNGQKQINVNINGYESGSNGIVYFSSTVSGENMQCGKSYQLRNVAYAQPGGFDSINDSASVTVEMPDCEEKPDVNPGKCSSLSVVKSGSDGLTYKYKLQANVDLGDYQIDRVEYFLDGELINGDVVMIDKSSDKTYEVRAAVHFQEFDGQTDLTADCSSEISPDGPMCQAEGKTHLPAGDEDCSRCDVSKVDSTEDCTPIKSISTPTQIPSAGMSLPVIGITTFMASLFAYVRSRYAKSVV